MRGVRSLPEANHELSTIRIEADPGRSEKRCGASRLFSSFAVTITADGAEVAVLRFCCLGPWLALSRARLFTQESASPRVITAARRVISLLCESRRGGRG